jgi:hypothetical protein
MYEVASQSSDANRPVLVHSCCRLGRTANPPHLNGTSMMRRLFWPLLGLLLLEGFFLNLSLGWMVAAAAIALFGYLACEAIRAHRALDDIISQMNAEIADRAEQADTASQLAAIGAHRDIN